MKLYATSDRNSLDKYVGTNLWVQVDVWDYYAQTYLHWYAKFLDANEYYYKTVIIPVHDVDSGILYNLDQMDRWTTWQEKKRFKLVTPVETLTNEEIFELWVPHGGEE